MSAEEDFRIDRKAL